MADSERTLNSEVTTELSIVQRDESQNEVAVDADETPTAEIRRLGVVVFTIEAGSVTHGGTGAYSFTWTPTHTGLHVITWSFTVGGDDYESEEKVSIVVEVEGTSDSDGEDTGDSEDVSSDLGTSQTCTVTAQFYDAGGKAQKGVYVRFTPDRDTEAFLTSGVVATETTAESDDDGYLEMTLVRGLSGTLSVTGLGLVRQVTVPNLGSTTLKNLVENGDDPLEVQRPRFKPLPRRS